MFHEHHHKNWFPLVVLVITLVLVVVVVLLFGPTAKHQISGDPVPTVTMRDYERNAQGVFERFDEALAAASIDVRQSVVRQTSSELLSLIVPVQYTDLHLDLVIALDELARAELTQNAVEIDLEIEDLNEIRNQYPWL